MCRVAGTRLDVIESQSSALKQQGIFSRAAATIMNQRAGVGLRMPNTQGGSEGSRHSAKAGIQKFVEAGTAGRESSFPSLCLMIL